MTRALPAGGPDLRGGAACSAAVRAAPALCVPVRPGMGSVPCPVLPAPSPERDTQGAGEAAVRVGGRETEQRRKHEPSPVSPFRSLTMWRTGELESL